MSLAVGIRGPVWIPKIYEQRNKTFFFFSDEAWRIRHLLPSHRHGTLFRDDEVPGAGFEQPPVLASLVIDLLDD
jgi:hypothetical protein